MSDRQTGEVPQCISCDSEATERRDNRCRCLDCGATYEEAPDGNSVHSVPVWWAVRIGYLSILLIALGAAVLNTVVFGKLLLTAVYVGMAVLVAVVNKEELRDLFRYGLA